MCGICGYYGPEDQETIERMTQTLYRRGPDDSGTWLSAEHQVAFGHRRLSILDLTKAGHQPMLSPDTKVVISYNGEVYNFLELRDELESKGRQFASRSDTEVILACYEKYGIDMVPLLDGIFAFALFDTQQRKIYLVRDHLGVKPLYYSFQNGQLFFGSEIKALLASNRLNREINYQALYDYLTFLYVPCPQTMYKGIFQLPPAHVLTFDLETGEYSLHQYWSPLPPANQLLSDPSEVNQLVRDTLAKTVKEQLVSDVPVGAFLSGGIDSNIVVGLMAEHSSKRVNTFTAVFTDERASYYNEAKNAARIARKFNTVHEELEIPTPSLEDISTMLSWTDQPFGNPTLFLSYLISEKIRQSITVALSGAGGDELFGGYVRYQHFNLARKIIRFSPLQLSPLAQGVVQFWPNEFRPELRNRVYKFLHGLVPDKARHYARWTYFLEDPVKRKLVSQAGKYLSSERVLGTLFEECEYLGDTLNTLEYLDLKSYLLDDILEYTDKSSMATSLEVRVPFLSPKMVELSLKIPGYLKIRRGQTKLPLRQAFADLFPVKNLQAPKRGFSAPTRIWAADMDKYFNEVESKLPPDNPLDLNEVAKLRQEHKSGRFNHGQVLFAILMLEIWLAESIYNV